MQDKIGRMQPRCGFLSISCELDTMMANPGRQSRTPAFELKGSMLTLTVLHLWQWNLDAVAAQLMEKVRQAPDFFRNVPLVIDLEAVQQAGAGVDFAELVALLRRCGFIPVAVRNGTPEQEASAAAAGLGSLPKGKSERAPRTSAATQPAPPPPAASKVVTQPIRSGQQVYAPGGDLIVLASVSAGAELLADGHIHVYGTLRGRALAGVRGDSKARIFCQGLEADLISVAGQYKLMEDLDQGLRGKPVQIYLEEDRLKVTVL